jgi:hypothetical protein
MDPVSGPRPFYRLADEDRVRRWYWIWRYAHLAYWNDPGLYRLITERLL